MEGQYGGLDVSEARRLKILTDENAKLKKLLAEALLPSFPYTRSRILLLNRPVIGLRAKSVHVQLGYNPQ